MKLPKNYVPGSGVVKATAFGGIGQKLMEKQGWAKGQGLGREKSGMTEALEVKEKKDTLGVGATGAWDWGHKFWEDAYNSVAKDIAHEGGSSSSDSDSDSSDDDTPANNKRKGPSNPAAAAASRPSQPKKSQAKAGKQRPSSSSSSSDSSGPGSGSDSDSSSEDSDMEAIREAAMGTTHRDGTIAGGASAAELAIAAQLAKDPWGRWGGKAGKMARIRMQEEVDAAKAREKLGLGPAVNGAAGKLAAGGGKAVGNGASTAQGGEVVAAAEEQVKKKERIVVTLQIKDDVQRGPFVPTPATGWWGAGYFRSAGPLEGMEEELKKGIKSERKTFNEDDQASLYMLVHENQRVGRKGLGKSTTIDIAGGKWEGSRKTFEEEGEGAGGEGGQQGEGDEVVVPEDDGAKEGKRGKGQKGGDDGSAGGKGEKKGKKRRAQAEVEEGQQGKGSSAGEETCKKQKQKRKDQDAGASKAEEQPNEHHQPIKWLKVAKLLIKQAPKRRLRLEKLCRQMLEHTQDKATEAGTGGNGLRHNMSHEKLHSLLHKKAKKSKVVIEDGFVTLPVPA